MIDIDHFKRVDDTYGHTVGDLVLERLADLFRLELRDIDTVARMGGEEFAVLLPITDGARALDVAERLRAIVAATSIALEQGLPLTVTISVGVATLAAPADNIDTLLSHADNALYEAKHAGRNRVVAARPSPPPPAPDEQPYHDD
jgi:diguanylate cyclase (GGDEF)-like protein